MFVLKNKKKRFLNIKNTLIAAFLILTIVPLATVSIFLNNSAKKEMKNEFIHSTKKEMEQVDNLFDTYEYDEAKITTLEAPARKLLTKITDRFWANTNPSR